MSRDELIALLTRLVMDGTLTEAEAEEIVDRFDAGELEEGWDLPIPPPMALEAAGFFFEEFVPVFVASQIATQARGVRPVWPESPDNLGDLFERTARSYAYRFSSRQITLAEWQSQMRELIVEYTAGQAISGGRFSTVSAQFQRQVMNQVRTQLAYLSRFADNMAMGRMSEAQIANRAIQYGGLGRGLFYQYRERETDAGQFGMVADYISLDDPATCVPCMEAERAGPYLPGEGPMPGMVCLGSGRCRCIRQVRYSPPDYLRLTRSVAA